MNQDEAISMKPIGHVRGGRMQATKDHWGDNQCWIDLDSRFSADALAGLQEVSHIEVLFYFHINADEPVEWGARHPRGRLDWPRVGILAQRGRMRPNRIGASICQVIAVRDTSIALQGLDAVDGSPVLDIKPVWRGYLPSTEVREPDWAVEIMSSYW